MLGDVGDGRAPGVECSGGGGGGRRRRELGFDTGENMVYCVWCVEEMEWLWIYISRWWCFLLSPYNIFCRLLIVILLMIIVYFCILFSI
ncbi:hypothetical protein HanIR_Chr16g0843181 [Helianthus annuus]|nr:hypothetical protein HanIR_Chr16g0843181 [Helianthus annuus]